MRHLFSSGSFWGIMLILLGALLIAKHMFNVDMPVGRIFFGLFMLLLGVMVITGSVGHKDSHTAVFAESHFEYMDDTDEYSAVFGQGTLDLRDVKPEKDIEMKAAAVFGEMRLILPEGANYIIHCSAAFGSVNVMGKSPTSGFGSSKVKSKNYDSSRPGFIIKADAVFGSINISR